jgi:hypothetical protein
MTKGVQQAHSRSVSSRAEEWRNVVGGETLSDGFSIARRRPSASSAAMSSMQPEAAERLRRMLARVLN